MFRQWGKVARVFRIRTKGLAVLGDSEEGMDDVLNYFSVIIRYIFSGDMIWRLKMMRMVSRIMKLYC